jgi:hypothetical protein
VSGLRKAARAEGNCDTARSRVEAASAEKHVLEACRHALIEKGAQERAASQTLSMHGITRDPSSLGRH